MPWLVMTHRRRFPIHRKEKEEKIAYGDKKKIKETEGAQHPAVSGTFNYDAASVGRTGGKSGRL